ncbi:MAG: preprotein translocase subunit YajC [Sporolactobacillus sp.]
MNLIIPLVLFVAIFYFMLIRPQQKRSKETREMQNSLQRGDKIVTIGGLHGTIESFDERTIEIRCNGSKLTFDRNAIREKVSKPVVQESATAVDTVGNESKKGFASLFKKKEKEVSSESSETESDK